MTVKELSEKAAVSGAAQALLTEESTHASYLESLEKAELYQDAIRFLAFKLSTDAGVKWASGCIKEMRSPESKEKPDEPLNACDAWVKTPGDQTRWAAKNAADNAKDPGPSNMIAMAVYMSGGSLAPPGSPETPPPAYAPQKFIAGSVLVTVVSHEPEKAKERYQQALKLGKTFDRG